VRTLTCCVACVASSGSGDLGSVTWSEMAGSKATACAYLTPVSSIGGFQEIEPELCPEVRMHDRVRWEYRAYLGKAKKWPLDKRNPNCLHGMCNDRVGDEAEWNDGNEGPGEESLNDPPVSCCRQNSGRDPPHEDEQGKGAELRTAYEAAGSGEPRPPSQNDLKQLAFNEEEETYGVVIDLEQ